RIRSSDFKRAAECNPARSRTWDVYAALDRLEKKGFVVSTVGDPTPTRGGRAKRYFRVTKAGLHEAQATRKALVNL
ncbi:MAG: PadR family transcriptional regulator, partial [Bryobacteraceae bacterium]